MSDTGILHVKASGALSAEQLARLAKYASDAAERLGYQAVVTDEVVGLEIHPPISGLVAALNQQTAAIQQLVESNAALIQAMAEAEGGMEGAYGEPEADFLD